MGVGDYVHSKEAGQLRSTTSNDATNSYQSRQSLAEQAKVGVPTTKLVPPLSVVTNGRAQQQQQHQQQEYHDSAGQGDMFDTDVEGVDDSTIAGTSVLDIDEPPPSYPSAQHQHTNNEAESRSSYQLQQPRRTYESTWYENLGDKAIKTAGFESDDADTEGSQMTSIAGEDERGGGDSEQTPTTDDWYLSNHHKHRSAEEQPLSRRLETFWAASKRTYAPPKSANAEQLSSSVMATSAAPTLRNPSQALPNRKITLPRSMTATPRTRFSPPKPSLLEQLELSPTRQTAGQRAQPSRPTSTTFPSLDNENDAESDNERQDSPQSVIAIDKNDNMDTLDNHDDDDAFQNPFSKRSSTSTKQSVPSRLAQPKKRQLEADYPPEILYQKSFTDLQAEPFDYTPPTTTAPPPQTTSATTAPTTPADQTQETTTDKVSLLLRLSEEERKTYLSNLSIDEWEECGDQLIDHFTTMLSKMKELRHARRKTAALFETEIKRRHDKVEEQSADLSKKLEEMREGGIGVLRGRTPDIT